MDVEKKIYVKDFIHFIKRSAIYIYIRTLLLLIIIIFSYILIGYTSNEYFIGFAIFLFFIHIYLSGLFLQYGRIKIFENGFIWYRKLLSRKKYYNFNEIKHFTLLMEDEKKIIYNMILNDGTEVELVGSNQNYYRYLYFEKDAVKKCYINWKKNRE